jgi:GldM C-terminal domain
MKKEAIIFLLFFAYFISNAQKFSIAGDKNNTLYLGLDNPLSIAVENYSCKSIIVKTDNGTISSASGKYIFHSTKIGKAEIILYRKTNGRTKEIGRSTFRVKSIPDPIAKVGPTSGGYINKVILRNQQYMRADYEYCNCRATIDSFIVCIVRGDTCLYNEIKNIGGKFSNEVISALSIIKKDDAVIFKKIFAEGLNDISISLAPILFVITD